MGESNMKSIGKLIVALCVLCPTCLWAEDFLGAPVLPGGIVVSKTESRLEKTNATSYEDAITFYKEAFKGEKDIKFRDRGGQTIIEDQAERPWHSISVMKPEQGEGVTVVIAKGSWTWAWLMSTLVLRFFGVFAVLAVLYLALSISGSILSKTAK